MADLVAQGCIMTQYCIQTLKDNTYASAHSHKGKKNNIINNIILITMNVLSVHQNKTPQSN